MKKVLGVGALGVAVVGGVLGLLAIGFSVTTYNGLVELEEDAGARFKQVEVQMQRRLDLIPNLVASVKGIAKQEQSIYLGLAEARGKYLAAAGVGGRVRAMNQMNSHLAAVVRLGETYPALRSDAHFRTLTDELSGTENRIATERKRFNDAVAEFNKAVRRFPGSLIAGVAGFQRLEGFTADVGAAQPPKVNF